MNRKILRRVLAAIPAVALQLLWIFVLAKWLLPWSVGINVVLSILAFLFVLYLITNQDESAYKILWLLVILTFPIAGAVLYLLFGNKRTTRALKWRLDKAPPLPPDTRDSRPLHQAIGRENKRLDQILRWVESKTDCPLCENNGTKYYPLGDTMFPDMLAALREAERFIFVEYFIIENGRMWDSMVEILGEKAAQGVDVRVLYDDLGSIYAYNRQDAEKLRKMGIRCAAFNPLVFVKGTLNCRDHRKMLVVDGKVAFSGGINLADEYINHVQKHGHWKDIGFRVTGAAVESYTRMFAQFWNAFTGDRVPDGYLAPSETGNPAEGYILSYYDSPLRSDAVSNELYIDLLSQAKDTAWFFTPYLMPGNALLDAFVRAARRGVDVRIIVPGVPDKKIVYRMTRSFYTVLLEGGVKIYEYEPGFVHAKACLIDGVVGTVGTVNLDYRSLFLHFENNALFYRAPLLEELKADLLETQEKCRERTKENVEASFWQWLVDGVLRIFAPLC